MRKKFKIIGLFLIGCIALVYIVMILNVMPVLQDARDVFRNVSTDDNIYCLRRYNTRRYDSDVRRRATIFPLLAFHNFKEGYVYVWYTNEVTDKDGLLLSGSFNIISKWKIKKIENEWKVIDISEDP